MPQFNATFGAGTVTLEGVVTDQELVDALTPFNQKVEGKADAIDDSLMPVTAVSGNTTIAFNPLTPSREMIVTVNTTLSIAPMASRPFRHNDGGSILIIHDASGSTVGFGGTTDGVYEAAPASQKAPGTMWECFYKWTKNVMVWNNVFINTANSTVAKRYYVKGNLPNGHISIPTYNTSVTPKVPLVTNDTGTFSILFGFRANPLEKTGTVEVLFAKGAGGSGTSYVTIGSNGMLSIGMGNAPEKRITFDDTADLGVMDNESHDCALVFTPGTSNNGFLKVSLDAFIKTRNDIPNIVYQEAPFNLLSLETGTPRYGTASKFYYFIKVNRAISDAEIVEARSGKFPNDAVVVYRFQDNANDSGPNGIHGIVTDSPVFGFEVLT